MTVLDTSNNPVQGATLNIANTTCTRCTDTFNVGSGLTLAGLPITSGQTTLWNFTPPSTNAAGQATILVWPTSQTENFTVTPPTNSGLTATSLTNIPLTSDQSITVHPPVGDQLTGRLVDDLGQPVSSVTMALSGTSVPTVSVTTGSTGTFAFTVPDGSYQVHLFTNNCSAPTGDVPGTTTDGCYWDLYTAAGALAVSGNRNFGDLALPRPTHVTVTVLDTSNNPVQGATLNIANTTCTRCTDTFNVGSGLTLAGLPITSGQTTLWNFTPPSTNAAGQATILVWPTSQTENFTVTPPTNSGLTATSLTNIPLTSDQSITVHPPVGDQLTGRLVDDLGQPVSSVTMALSGTSVPTVSVTTGSTGTFAFTVPDGSYQVHLFTNNCSAPTGDVPGTTTDGCYWDLYTAAGALAVSGNRNFGDLALPRPTHVTVTVLDTSNNPVQGATLNIANTTCTRCTDTFNVGSGLTLAGLPITSGQTTLWNFTPPSTNAAGQATILVWPTSQTENFTVTPPTNSGLTATSLTNIPLTSDVNAVIFHTAGGTTAVLQARADAYTVTISGDLNVHAPGVLANDAVDATATAALVANVSHGALTFSADGSFDYRPTSGYFGQDSFTYTVSQGGVTSSPTKVSITVTGATPTRPAINNIPSSAVVGGAFTPDVNTTGDGTRSITSSTPNLCTVTSATVSFLAVGTCTLTAHVAAGPLYLAGDGSPQSFSVGKATQVISFTSTAPTNAAVGSHPYTVTASGGPSSSPVTFSADSSSSSVCSVYGFTVVFVGTGTCTVDANQAGDSSYLAAPQRQQSFSVGAGSQTYLYAVENVSGTNEVRAYKVAADGSTTAVGTYSTGHPGGVASWLVGERVAATLTSHFLYALNLGDHTVTSFAVDPDTGALSTIVTTPALGATSIAVNPSGTVLYAAGASQVGGQDRLASYAINADGTLGATPVATVTGPEDGLAISPDGTELAAAYPGTGQSPAAVTLWSTDSHGHLSALSSTTASCPTDVRFISASQLVSAACYSGTMNAYGVSNGHLTLTSSSAASARPASSQTLAIGNDGYAYYDTDQGLQGASVSSTPTFTLGPATAYAGGAISSLTLTPDGTHVYVASLDTSSMTEYAVGALVPGSGHALSSSTQVPLDSGLPSLTAFVPVR